MSRPAIWFSIVVLFVGCRGSDRLPTYKATGKITFSDGTPLEGGTILFEPTERVRGARGLIGTDGTFTLGTYESSDGAVAGKHVAAIIPSVPDDFDPDAGRVPRTIHQRYTHMDTSGLEFEVKPEGSNDYQITVERSGR